MPLIEFDTLFKLIGIFLDKNGIFSYKKDSLLKNDLYLDSLDIVEMELRIEDELGLPEISNAVLSECQADDVTIEVFIKIMMDHYLNL